jgi:hypothetical protein
MAMKRERWLILTFVPALMLFNAFVVLNYTGLSYKPFSWAASAAPMAYPDGDPCMTGGQCASTFCVDTVCCESACPPPGNCNIPGHAGTCIEPAPAPALSGTGLLIAALLLAGIGTAGLIRKRRQDG